MSMASRITQFKIGTPDSDGDVNVSVGLQLANDKTSTIRLVTWTTLLIGPGGVKTDSENQRKVNLAPGKNLKLPNSSFYAKVGVIGSNPAALTLHTRVGLFERMAICRATVTVPEIGTSVMVPMKADGLDAEFFLTVTREKPDDDGDGRVEVAVVVDPHGTALKAGLNVSLRDDADSTIETNDSEQEIRPYAFGALETSFWNVDNSLLDSAAVCVTLNLYKLLRTIDLTQQGAEMQDNDLDFDSDDDGEASELDNEDGSTGDNDSD